MGAYLAIYAYTHTRVHML